MKLFTSIILVLISLQLSAQSLCELKTPTLIYNKVSQSYHIEDEIKPYKILWYRNDTLIKTSLSYRTSPQQLISIPNFRHFEVCPHILRNGDIYFLGDSFFHYSVFKVNQLNKTYDRQFNLSDYVTENKIDFFNSLLNGVIGNTYLYNKDSSHDITNCFIMDNQGIMYIDKVYMKNFIAFSPQNNTYKLIDSNTSIVYPTENFTFRNFLYIYQDKTLFKSKTIPTPFNSYLRFSNPLFSIDSLKKIYDALYNISTSSFSTGFYRNKRYLQTQSYEVWSLNPNFDTIIEKFNTPTSLSSYGFYRPSLIDGQGTIYMTKRESAGFYNEIHTDYIYTFNFHSQLFDSVQMPKDSLILSMVSSSVRIDCSGSLYAFGYLYKNLNDHRYNNRHTLNLYKQTAYIDTGLTHNFDTTLTAIVYYYDADSVILNSKNPKRYIDTSTCTQFSYRGKNYTQTGNYTDTFYNTTIGIDTILYIKLTQNKIYKDTIKQTSCDSFTYKNTPYKNSGTYTYPYKSIYNCDSFHTLNLTINKSKSNTINYQSCTPYKWNDSTYSQSGTYTRLFKTINQCDSIVTLNLKIGLNNKVNINNGINYTAQQDSVSYQWYRCNPWRRITNETKQTFTTTTKGSYAVVLDNGKGCKDTSDCIALYSSGFATTIDAMTRIYPNPFNSNLTIELDKFHSEINIKIYDLSGRQILNTNYLNRDTIELDLKFVSKGTYYLQIETENYNQFYTILKD